MFAKTLAALLAFTSIQGAKMSHLDPHTQTVSISVNSSVLLALIKLGSDTHTPLGVVLEEGKPEKLCEEHRQITVQDRPMADFLDALLTRSNYIWSADGGVIVIQPAHLSDDVSRVLNMKFDRFGGMQTTMQGLGINLTGWIHARLHPEASGFAADILSSPDAEQFSQLEIRNASVEQILNHIVSLGSKGIWILRLRQNFERTRDIDLHTYSYKDDARGLQTICNAISR
jgi:hypothetical protein